MTMYPTNNPMANLHDGKFTNGDPKANIMPSVLPAETLNLILDNLEKLVVEGGGNTDDHNSDQVFQGIKNVSQAVFDENIIKVKPNYIWQDNLDYVIGDVVATVDSSSLSFLLFGCTAPHTNKHPHLFCSREWKRLDLPPAGTILYTVEDAAPIGTITAFGFHTRSDFPRIEKKWNSPSGQPDKFMFPDFRGRYIRSTDDGANIIAGYGAGSMVEDAIRNLTGWAVSAGRNLYTSSSQNSAIYTYINGGWVDQIAMNVGRNQTHDSIGFDASRQVPTADENRPKTIFAIPIVCV